MDGHDEKEINLGDAPGVDESAENKVSSNPPMTQKAQLRTWRDTVGMFNREHRQNTGKTAVVLLAGGAIFGAIHFLAWKTEMPTSAEVIIWRFAAVFLTAFPFYAFLVGVILAAFGQEPPYSFWATFLLLFVIFGSLMHPLLRAMVAVDALALLRQLPDTAYRELSWSDVIPSL